MHWLEYVSLFTLGFSSMFPLINPVGTALIINPELSHDSLDERKKNSFSIVMICFIMGVVTLFAGSWFLRFMGVSIPTTQMAGGILLARMGMMLLSVEGDTDSKGSNQSDIGETLFYPLAFPLTLGPGGLATLITLSAHAHTVNITETLVRMGVIAASLAAILVITYFCFSYTHVLIKRIGHSGSRALNRLMAFVVFCIGIQMFILGLTRTYPNLFH